MLRTLLNTRRSFHLSSVTREEWTKASLRRMKKPELLTLGKENNLKLSGTKNDIIIQLLTHQTAKIVGVQTPASVSIPKTKPQPAFGSLDTDSYPEEDELLDQAWANAFEMKVAQRGSRKPKTDHHSSNSSTSSPPTPHHFNQQIKVETLLNPDDLTKPVPEIIGGFEPKNVIEIPEDLEGMDSQWVEAFDLKVGSRGARSVLIDTLSPVTTTTTTTTSPSLSTLEDLDFVTIEKKVNDETESKSTTESIESKPTDESKSTQTKPTTESKSNESNKPTLENSIEKKFDHVKEHTSTSEQLKEIEKTTTKDTTTTDDNTINRGKFINTAVGSSMILWYFGGEEGLRNIWHFLTSS